jgi:hypothetical protein
LQEVQKHYSSTRRINQNCEGMRMSERIIHAQDIMKNTEQSFPQCVFITDSSVKAWSFNSMATAINLLSQKGYEVKTMWISPQGSLCYVIMQKR